MQGPLHTTSFKGPNSFRPLDIRTPWSATAYPTTFEPLVAYRNAHGLICNMAPMTYSLL